MPKKTLSIVALSGGTGRTCEEVVRAALAQFDGSNVALVRKPNVRSPQAAKKIVREAHKTGAIICHTLVATDVREAVAQEAKTLMVPTVDLMGRVLTVLDDYLPAAPRRQPGLSYALKKEEFDRIDAVNYTLAHDDGLRSHELSLADVVLVGPSRVSKSVTCFYLAYRGIRAANVPLVAGFDPPDELLALEKENVIGLNMNARRLQSIREARVEGLAQGLENYSDAKSVASELRYANRLIAEQGWRTIDVSYKATEEVAREIVGMIGR